MVVQRGYADALSIRITQALLVRFNCLLEPKTKDVLLLPLTKQEAPKQQQNKGSRLHAIITTTSS